MIKIDYEVYEADKGQSVVDFARELLNKYEDKNCPIIGIFNDIPILLKEHGVTIDDICNELLGF